MYLHVLLLLSIFISVVGAQKVSIKAVGIPLADHYAGIIAYEKYKEQMKYADYQIKILPGPNLVRRYFRSYSDVDIAFNVAPMVMDMYSKKPNFRWISLIHRDGNALAINCKIDEKVMLNTDRTQRKPTGKVAFVIDKFKKYTGKPVEIAVPSLLATHTTILYKYFKDNNKTIGLHSSTADISLDIVKPPNSIAYLKAQTIRRVPAAFEQSLPWAEIIEAQGNGHIAWYSKDVMKHDKGHVECIIIAKDDAIEKKRDAIKEVIYFIHRAGQDIETAREQGGEKFDDIIRMIRKHIPQHTVDSIKKSLSHEIMAINYKNLNVDKNSKDSFRKIMDLAYEAGFIKEKVNIDELADESFSISIKDHSLKEEK